MNDPDSNAPLRLGRRSTLRGALATVASGASARAAGIAITDALGRKMALKGPAQRVVLGFNYEEFTAIAGAAGWDRVVGYSKANWAGWRMAIWTRYVQAVPRIREVADVGMTDDGSFSVEKVIALRPDLVILPEWAFSVLGQATTLFESLGIPVLVIDYNAETLERHLASTRAIGAAMGTRERAEALAALYEQAIADIRRRVAAAAGVSPKVYLELGDGGADVVGNTYVTTMWGRLLDLLAATNIAKGHIAGALGPLSPEYVLAANPDFVFITGSSWVNQPHSVRTGYDVPVETTRRTLAPYAHRQGWPGLAAIKANQLCAIEHGLARTLYDFTATQYIGKQLYPRPFADVDPVENLRRYHQQFLPVRFSGTWMARIVP